MTCHVKILRGKQGDALRYDEFTVAFAEHEVVSVMNVLEKIAREQDPTLAFFDHAACRQAACGKCLLKLNGAPKLACKEKALPEMTLEPAHMDSRIRDLLCKS